MKMAVGVYKPGHYQMMASIDLVLWVRDIEVFTDLNNLVILNIDITFRKNGLFLVHGDNKTVFYENITSHNRNSVNYPSRHRYPT